MKDVDARLASDLSLAVIRLARQLRTLLVAADLMSGIVDESA